MKAVILAAGEGNRLWPISENVPKPLVKILGKYFLEYQIIELSRLGIKDIIVIKSHNFTNYFEEFQKKMSEKYGVIISYIIQEKALGTGNAFLMAKNIIKEPFIGLMGDNHYQANDIQKLINTFNQDKKSVIGGLEVKDPQNYGVINYTTKGKVINIIEKPIAPESNLINAAIYIFKPEIFSKIETLKPHENGETYITDAINMLIEENDLVVEKIENWHDLGQPFQILNLIKYFMKQYRRYNNLDIYQEIKPGVFIGKNVIIGKNVTMLPGEGIIIIENESKVLGSTLIMGSNYIGKNCSIFNSILRETSVLLGNNKVSLSELKNTTLGVRTNAPHFNYIGDSYIGEDCNFGAGTKVSNVRNDNKPIKVFLEKKDKLVTTKYRKLGIFTGNNVKFGINTSIGQPGLLIGSNVRTTPGSKIFRNLISQ